MTKYSFDPDFENLLPLLPTETDFGTLEAIQAVRADRQLLMVPTPDRGDIVKEDRMIPGREGDPDVPIRIYRGRDWGEAIRPCVVEIHGGGFIMGSIEMMDAWCQHVVALVGTVVVSVDYRLAPEDPFPAGVEDCFAALRWTAANAAELGVDPDRIAIAGQSAGGGLAAGTALLARDRGGPSLCFQLLEIPELDHRLETPSMKAFTDTPLWNRPNAISSWRHYLGADYGGLGADYSGLGAGHSGEVSPYASPSVAKDLSGLPSAYVSTMEFDPLRDEGIDYAVRLLQAGVSVELHSYPGTFHGSGLVPEADASQRNSAEVMAILKRRLAG